MQKINRFVALTLVVALFVTGCATTKGGQSDGGDGKCGVAAVGGAVAGALIGALLSRNKVQGALIGAGGGAVLGGVLCLAVTAESRQTKTASQVEQDYRSQNSDSLPPAPQVQSYSLGIVPTSGAVKRGETLVIHSEAQVVRGLREDISSVKEVIQLKLGNDVLQTADKNMNAAGSGAFDTTYSIPIPQRFQDGTYTIASALYVNGQQTGMQRQGSFYIVTLDDGVRYAFREPFFSGN